MLAGVDSLVGLIIFAVITMIASWLKKKQGEGTDDSSAPPPRRSRTMDMPAPPPLDEPAQPVSWEAELRRLLQGETAETPTAPPPPVVYEARRPAPPQFPQAEPPPLPEHRDVFEVIEEPNPMNVDVQPRFQPLPTLTESVQAYQQASQLDRKVQDHLREVTQRPVGSTGVLRKGATPEATAALALVRSRHSVRAALLASVILGPPKALAE